MSSVRAVTHLYHNNRFRITTGFLFYFKNPGIKKIERNLFFTIYQTNHKSKQHTEKKKPNDKRQNKEEELIVWKVKNVKGRKAG